MFAVRYWLAIILRGVAAAYQRSRVQLAALAVTAIAASLLLPGPWDASRAEAAKAQELPTRELVELRSAKTKTVRQQNGQLKTTLSEQSLHFLDAERRWQEIDASFKASFKQGAKWESGANRFSVELSEQTKDGFLALATPQGAFSLSLEGASPAAGVKPKENTITFKDALPDVDLEYVVLPDGLKESIVLRNAGAPSEYRFRLEPAAGDAFRAEEREDGVWFFGESGSEPAFVLLEPVVGDSRGQATPQPDSALVSPPSFAPEAGKASLEVEEEEGDFLVTLRIDEKWLESAERVYPVVLDPSWFVQPDSADGDYNTTSGGNPNVSATEIRTGRDGAGGAKYASVFSFELASLPPGARVLDARLNVRLNACFPSACGPTSTGDVELRRLTSGWSASTPWSAVTKDATLQEKISFTGTPAVDAWYVWGSGTFTESVQAMVNGTLPNYGLILEKTGGNDASGYKWRSARWSDPSFAPLLNVYWVGDGVQVNPALSLHGNGAELHWQHYAPGTSAYADAVLADNPVGYWRLDEPAGDTAVWDWSGKDNSGLVMESAGVVRAEPGEHLADKNLTTKFLGTTNGYIKVYDDPTLRVNDTFTLEAWIRRIDLLPRNLSIFNDFGAGFWLRLEGYSNRLQLLANANGNPITESTAQIADTAWHHVAATKSGSAVKLYIDGADVTGTVTNATLTSSSQGFHLGQTDGLSGGAFYGWIDEAALYPSALTATRIQAHYGARQTPMPGFQRFEIHRSASANFTPSPSTLVGTIGDVVAQSYRDTSAKPASTFYYEVVTVTEEGSFSSNEVKADLPAAGTAQVTIQPGYLTSAADVTHISSATPDLNTGTSPSLVVGSAGSNHTRALLSFDMRSIPSAATITSAELRLYALGTTPGIPRHRLAAMWTEAGATWNQRDKNQTLAWQSVGGDFDSTSTSSAGGTNLHWDTWGLTALLQQWLAGDKAHFGVLLKHGSENGSQPTLAWAADGFANSIALRPKLVVSYSEESPAVAPTVAVSKPAPEERVAGQVIVRAGALDDGRVASVQFLLDGNALGSPDTAAPYELAWNTASASRGQHTLTAKAIDEAGNETTSPPVAVAVANSTAPTTQVTSATAGSGGVWSVDASASDDFGLERVEFYLDGDRFASDSSSPYAASLDTLAFPAYDGPRTLQTKAYDGDGNLTTSAAYPITVANTTGTKYKATIATANVPLEQSYDPGAGSQEGAPLTVSLTNGSSMSWASASTKLRYRWLSADSPPVAIDSADVSIGADLGAGQQRDVYLTVDPPTLPTGVYRARYKLRLDLYDTAAASYFAAKGNAPYEAWVTVTREVADELGLERYQQYDGEDLGGGFDHALNLANGNNVVQWVPFSQPGRGLNTVVSLTYNSLEHGSVSPLGNNWSLAISSLTPFGLPLDVHPNAADTAAGRTQKWVGFTDGDGSHHVFTGNAAGTYYSAPPGVHLYLKKTGATGWELWKPDRTKFVFDAAGFPTKVEDANGNALTITLATPAPGEDAYGLGKRVTTVTDAGGREFNLAYFSKAETPTPAMRGKLERISDHVGHALEFSYYEDGNLRSIREKGGPGDDGMPTPDREAFLLYTTPSGGPSQLSQEEREDPPPATVQSPKLYSLIDFRGNETVFAYSTAADAKKWRLTGRTNRAENETTFAYDTTLRKTTATMPLARVWAYTFDSEGRVTQIDDPLNTAHTNVEWADATAPNEVANVVRKVTAPSGEFVEYAYNANGYKTDEWDELRNRTSFEYQHLTVDANDVPGNWEPGRPIAHLSQLVAVVKPRGNATGGPGSDYRWEFSYTPANPVGMVWTITDPLGHVTTNAWNANGTLASQALPANGDAITRTTTFTSYDANGLPTQVTDAAGVVSKAGYAANGNLLWLQDPNHASLSGSAPSDYRTEHAYDAHGRLVSTSQPKSTAFTRGLLIWDGQAYDANDNELTSIAAHYGRGDGRNGAPTTTVYDAMDRPTLFTGPRSAAEGGPVKTQTEYDAAGRVTKMTKPKGVNSAPSGQAWAKDHVTETAYDLLDRETAVTAHAVDDSSGNVDAAATRVTNRCYDDAGDLRSLTGPKGAAGFACPNPAAEPYLYASATNTTKFEYDDAHRQVKATDALGNVTQTAYDENGQVTSETDELNKVTQSFYDDRGLKTKTVEPFDTGRTLTTISEYDPLGNLKRLISPRAFDAAGGQAPYTNYVESYSYDALERLVKTTLPVGQGANYYFSTALADGPAAYWRFGSSAADETSPPSDAFIQAGAPGQPGALAGDPDGSLACTGGGICASVEEADETNPYWSLSVEAWLKTSSGANQTLFSHNDHGVKLWIAGGAFGFKWTTDINRNGWSVGTPGGYADGNWHHVVAVFENWSCFSRIYVDGVQKAFLDPPDDPPPPCPVYYSTSAATIGGEWGGNYFTGSLDEVAFYGGALSEAQVQAHYAARVLTSLPQAYRHQAYDANGNTRWTSLPTLEANPALLADDEKTTLAHWDTGTIYSSQDPARPKVRFDYAAEGWQAARIPEVHNAPGFLDFSQAMYWDYLPDGLLRALRDEGGERALYSYDANGNRWQSKEATGLVASAQAPLPIDLSYNSLDELVKVRTPKPGASGTYLATTLAYDLHGNTEQLVDNREEDAGGSQSAAGRVHTYTYNALDQPATQTDDFATTDQNDDEQLSYTYTPRGELDTRTLSKRVSGAWDDEQSSLRTYFDNGLLKQLRNRKGDPAQTVIEQHTLTYTRDGIYLNGNRASDNFYMQGPDSNAPCWYSHQTCTSTWSYDARERLTMEIPGTGQTRAHTLDVRGNVTAESAGHTTTRTYAGEKLITQTVAGIQTRFLHDSLGNQDCSVKSAYAGTTCPAAGNANLIDDNLYDYKSRLQGYRYYNGAPTASKASDYTNDPLDRPVKQVESIAGSGTTYDFTYVGVTNALSKEVLAGATNATKRYAYDALGQRSTIAETKAGETKRYSYLYDPHTSVSLLIDQANLVKESYGYQAYGAANVSLTRTASGFDAKTNPYRYTGKRLDSGSGTYDMGARRYSASTGRFLQYDLYADALDNLQLSIDPLTQNRYGLAGGNPITFVELDGHAAGPAAFCVALTRPWVKREPTSAERRFCKKVREWGRDTGTAPWQVIAKVTAVIASCLTGASTAARLFPPPYSGYAAVAGCVSAGVLAAFGIRVNPARGDSRADGKRSTASRQDHADGGRNTTHVGTHKKGKKARSQPKRKHRAGRRH